VRQIETIAGVRAAIATARARGERIGFVPTMGFLHEGHLRLVDEAKRMTGCVVMSLFVNPTQFGPNEDFSRYPRDVTGDVAKAEARSVDLLFLPSVAEMYPTPPSLHVMADDLPTRWEGEVRRGHFSGVLTVVAKLFNIVAPDVAVFGRKDYQQATLIRRMVRELNFPIEIVVAPTVRERDGLALSSRNTYLDASARTNGLALVTSLRAVPAAFAAGERSGSRLTAAGRETLAAYPDVRVDYFAVVDPTDMRPVATASADSVAIVAARVGATRLIDNMILGEAE
jgi:pantoate--beta-alanine ligase